MSKQMSRSDLEVEGRSCMRQTERSEHVTLPILPNSDRALSEECLHDGETEVKAADVP